MPLSGLLTELPPDPIRNRDNGFLMSFYSMSVWDIRFEVLCKGNRDDQTPHSCNLMEPREIKRETKLDLYNKIRCIGLGKLDL